MPPEVVARVNGNGTAVAESSGHHRHRDRPAELTNGASSSSRSKSQGQIVLSAETLKTFHVSKIFAEPLYKPQHTVTSLAFDDRGEYLVTAGDDDTIHIFSCTKGKHNKTLYSKKYGVHLARFTHRNDSIIYASNKEDDTIRHHSLHDNKYLQYFRGHHSKVTSLQMSPVSELFLSGAQDESLRLWDLRSSTCQGQFPLQGRPVIAWDPTGVVFALGIGEAGTVLLYDVRTLSPQPLLTISLGEQTYSGKEPDLITSLAFHPAGRTLLIGTANDSIYIADAYTGRLLYTLNEHESLRNSATDLTSDPIACGQEMGWAPDGHFVFAGSESRGIQFWQVPELREAPAAPLSLSPSLQLQKQPGQRARAVACNPRHAMMASASNKVALWLPPAREDEDD